MFDPFTPEVVIALSGVVAQYLRDGKMADALTEINSKLDLIIGNTNQIIAELKNIEIMLPEELEKGFRDNEIRKLTGKHWGISSALAELYDRNTKPEALPDIKKRLKNLYYDLVIDTGTLTGYGPPAYAAVSAGYNMLLCCAKSSGLVPSSAIDDVTAKVLAYFARIVTNSGNISFGTSLNNFKTKEADLWNQIITHPRNGYLGGRYYCYGPKMTACSNTSYYLTLIPGLPSSIEGRSGFRFKGSIECVPNDVNNRRWFTYYTIVPEINTFISHMNGASDETGKVLARVNTIASQRDAIYERQKNVETIISIINKIAETISTMPKVT